MIQVSILQGVVLSSDPSMFGSEHLFATDKEIEEQKMIKEMLQELNNLDSRTNC